MPAGMLQEGGGVGMGPNGPPMSPAMMSRGGRAMGGDDERVRVREMSKELDTLKSELEQTRRTLARSQGACEDPQPKAAWSVAFVFPMSAGS
jgi:hypothetical protein